MKSEKQKLKIIALVILLIIAGVILWYFQSHNNANNNQPKISNLEYMLLDTAWVLLDPNGGKTDFEIDFGKTKENDLKHTYYDYSDFLHQRPGEIGYWKVDNNIITIVSTLSNFSPIIYTNVTIKGNILNVTDSDGNRIRNFIRVP